MIQKEKLAKFYLSQYRECATSYKKKKSDSRGYERRAQSLGWELMSHMKAHSARLEDYHRQVKNISYYAFRKQDRVTIMHIRDTLIPELVRLDLTELKPDEQTLLSERFLEYLRTEMPYEICSRTLRDLCLHYADVGVKGKILDLVPTKPETEFPKALEMKRNFILHIGPTNCGKTYQALERLKEAGNGVYLGPLRLLALEVYEKMLENGVPCTMLTGEECLLQENSKVISSTIEMLDIEQEYDVAVIDEAQMIKDRDRGHSWTRAILGLQAKEIHVCMSSAARGVITHLISLCNDSYECHEYERKTPLICEDTPFRFPEDVQDGDALIVFTKRAVLDIAGRLEREGIHTSVIYGSLPPEIRRRQIRLFSGGENKVVVSTDAIGMGLNLPVRRIVFLQADKFDGRERRRLKVEEIRQIAGRAGRYGIHDTGYVNAMGEDTWEYIKVNFAASEPPIERVSLGFPNVLLGLDEPLDTILKVWKSVEPSEPFEKISIDEVLFLYEKAYSVRKKIDGFSDKFMLYRLLTCSIDIKNKDIVNLWLDYCMTYTADVKVEFPSLERCRDKGLARFETYYKMLDLYHQFSTRLGKEIDSDRLETEREKTETTIMRYLMGNKKDYIEVCRFCGRTLPLASRSRICDDCYTEWVQTNAARRRRYGREEKTFMHK